MFFAPTTNCSLLHFSSITRLSLRYEEAWDWPKGATSIDLFIGLLLSAPTDTSAFPHLLHFDLSGVTGYDWINSDWQALSRLQSLTSLRVAHCYIASLDVALLLLTPPALQLLDVIECVCLLNEENDAEWGRTAIERGVEIQRCSAPAHNSEA